ncbi:hypothetical protein B6A42_07300 [Vibrio coralliilyticus]|nr:hypothetical protein B6A42_07300 [Vibrio coralliilyticus]
MELQTTFLDSLDGEDELGVVIRSHIHVEQYLNALIVKLNVNEKYLDKMELTYFQTVRLAIGLGLDPRFESALCKLGKIRNDFAHNIRGNLTEDDAKSLYQCLSGTEKNTLQSIVKKTSKELDHEVADYNSSDAKHKYIYAVTMICAALQTACKQAT